MEQVRKMLQCDARFLKNMLLIVLCQGSKRSRRTSSEVEPPVATFGRIPEIFGFHAGVLDPR